MLPGFTARTAPSIPYATSRPAAPPKQPLPVGSERDADGNLLLAAGGAGEQQVGDVRARDQQHQRDRTEQDEHRPPHVADDLIDQGHDADGERSIPLVFVADSSGNHADVGLRLLERHAGLEPPHQVVVFVVARVRRLGSKRKRDEQLHPTDARHGRHHLIVQGQVGGEDAGDGELIAFAPGCDTVQRDASADHVGVGAKQPTPEIVAEDGDGRSSRDVVVAQQQPEDVRSTSTRSG
jgi:hypothetical protein